MSQELKDQTEYLLRGHRAVFNQNPRKEDLMKHVRALQTRVNELSAAHAQGEEAVAEVTTKPLVSVKFFENTEFGTALPEGTKLYTRAPSGIPDEKQAERVARAFWRRIYPYRNDYGKELPKDCPVEFSANMATALCALQCPINATQPAPLIPDDWKIKPVKCDSVYGYMISSPRKNGVRQNTVIFKDSENPAERLLYLMLVNSRIEPENGHEPTQ